MYTTYLTVRTYILRQVPCVVHTLVSTRPLMPSIGGQLITQPNLSSPPIDDRRTTALQLQPTQHRTHIFVSFHVPQTHAQIITPVVIQYSLGNGIFDLRPDMIHIFPKLEPIDVQEATEREGAAICACRCIRERKGKWDVVFGCGKVEIELSRVEAETGAGEPCQGR